MTEDHDETIAADEDLLEVLRAAATEADGAAAPSDADDETIDAGVDLDAIRRELLDELGEEESDGEAPGEPPPSSVPSPQSPPRHSSPPSPTGDDRPTSGWRPSSPAAPEPVDDEPHTVPADDEDVQEVQRLAAAPPARSAPPRTDAAGWTPRSSGRPSARHSGDEGTERPVPIWVVPTAVGAVAVAIILLLVIGGG